MKNILVPCDFSNPAKEAFKFAVKIASQSKGEIHVLYVLDITFLNGSTSVAQSYAFNLAFLKDMETEAERKFETMRKDLAPMTMRIKFTHNVSSLVPEIEQYTREKNIDLIVIGTHGQSNSGLGSNAEKVVRHSPVPVIAVRKTPEKNISSIVLPVLPDQASKDLVDEIKNLQRFFNAKIHLLWVNTPTIFKADQESETDLRQFAEDFKLDNYSINIYSDYTVENGILRFAKTIDADMIAMGTHARKGFVHLLTGSVTEDTVNHATTPIWTYAIK